MTTRLNNTVLFTFLVLSFAISGANSAYAAGTVSVLPEVKYGIGKWTAEKYGNHRAVIRVGEDGLGDEKADAVVVRIPWRRRDPQPEKKCVIVVDSKTGQEVVDLVTLDINREYGEILFRPTTVPGDYYVYYMPYRVNHSYFPNTKYLEPLSKSESKVDAAWQKKWEPIARRKPGNLTQAKVVEIQAVNDFYRMDPMEVTATEAERKAICEQAGDAAYLLFPEDRKYPIAMRRDLPYRWIKRGPTTEFTGTAQPGEYYTFQVGLLALKEIEDVEVELYSIQGPGGNPGDDDTFTCFNTGGIDWLGRPFDKKVEVPEGIVQALWCGLKIPKDTPHGTYKAVVTVSPKSKSVKLNPTSVDININVSGEVLEDGGVSDLKRMARLEWLNSTIGLDDEVFGVYTPVKMDGDTISILGRKLVLDPSGLPRQIISTFDDTVTTCDAPERKMLASPMKMVVVSDSKPIKFNYGPHRVEKKSSGAIDLSTKAESSQIEMTCRSKIECDGYANYTIELVALKDCLLDDVRLEIPMRAEIAEYMMGLGRKGGRRPEKWDWKWDINRSNSVLWLGTVGAGLQCRLKPYDDIWEMFNFKDTGLPEDWSNDGQGGCTIAETADSGGFLAKAYSGKHTLKKGERLIFRFGLLITPVRTLGNEHWQWRYWHAHTRKPDSLDEVEKSGAKVLNIHQANLLNPYINYPFINQDVLKAYVADANSRGVEVKLYYTIRELSIRTAEVFALRSLGDEIFRTGEGFRLADRFALPTTLGGVTGESWLCEHLIYDYLPAWHDRFGDADWDAAIAQSGLSRWHNYYLEGLNYLIRNLGINGIYIDGLGYDREVMKRVRKVMDRARPGCLIDFHCGNHFHADYGLNNISGFFMEHFPYMSSLWLGEGFDYNETPDYWLIELAGIPYGLYGEMLGQGNPWRGMVYGMSNRLKWGGDPREIWKIWDDFGIDKAQMLGYWSKRCPVKTDDDMVKATAYVREGKTLIAVASWTDDKKVNLSIDWKAIGLDGSKAVLHAPAIPTFQDEATCKPGQPIEISAGRGVILIVE